MLLVLLLLLFIVPFQYYVYDSLFPFIYLLLLIRFRYLIVDPDTGDTLLIVVTNLFDGVQAVLRDFTVVGVTPHVFRYLHTTPHHCHVPADLRHVCCHTPHTVRFHLPPHTTHARWVRSLPLGATTVITFVTVPAWRRFIYLGGLRSVPGRLPLRFVGGVVYRCWLCCSRFRLFGRCAVIYDYVPDFTLPLPFTTHYVTVPPYLYALPVHYASYDRLPRVIPSIPVDVVLLLTLFVA